MGHYGTLWVWHSYYGLLWEKSELADEVKQLKFEEYFNVPEAECILGLPHSVRHK